MSQLHTVLGEFCPEVSKMGGLPSEAIGKRMGARVLYGEAKTAAILVTNLV